MAGPVYPPRSRLSVRNLACSRNDRELFADLSFELEAGGLVQIVGTNGSGKTTLLRCLCGLFTAENGEVLWNGAPIEQQRAEYLMSLSYVGHKAGIKDDLTPVENLHMDAVLAGNHNGIDPRTALAQVGIERVGNVPCRALSMGQRRRVALARLLVTHNQLWVLDEPLAALDHAGQEMVADLLQAHSKQGGMVVFSSHQSFTSSTKLVSIVLGDD